MRDVKKAKSPRPTPGRGQAPPLLDTGWENRTVLPSRGDPCGRPWAGWGLAPRQFWGGPHVWHPPLHPATPCHSLSGNRPATRRWPDGRGSGDGQPVVARGAVGGGWALVGARPHGAAGCMGAPQLSGREVGLGGCKQVRQYVMNVTPGPAENSV